MLEYKIQKKDQGPNTFSFGLTPLRIVFMGTPDFAVASLDAVLAAGYQVVAVITAPDKPAGRGMKLTGSAVKHYAIERGIPVLQPEKLKNPEFLEQLRAYNADLQLVVAFRMLPEVVWSMPRMGSVNLHGSLLPLYRGAAPINWAVINGEAETGVTTFQLQQAIDTGEILLQESFPIGENETAGEVHDRMKQIGAALLVQTVAGLIDGSITGKPQPYAKEDAGNDAILKLKHAPKIDSSTGLIDFNRPVRAVHDLVRGLSPFPGAYTHFQGRQLKIFRTLKEEILHNAEPGSFLTDGKSFLKFVCPDGYIQVLELQPEGKKKMNAGDFVRGLNMRASQ